MYKVGCECFLGSSGGPGERGDSIGEFVGSNDSGGNGDDGEKKLNCLLF